MNVFWKLCFQTSKAVWHVHLWTTLIYHYKIPQISLISMCYLIGWASFSMLIDTYEINIYTLLCALCCFRLHVSNSSVGRICIATHVYYSYDNQAQQEKKKAATTKESTTSKQWRFMCEHKNTEENSECTLECAFLKHIFAYHAIGFFSVLKRTAFYCYILVC